MNEFHCHVPIANRSFCWSPWR